MASGPVNKHQVYPIVLDKLLFAGSSPCMYGLSRRNISVSTFIVRRSGIPWMRSNACAWRFTRNVIAITVFANNHCWPSAPPITNNSQVTTRDPELPIFNILRSRDAFEAWFLCPKVDGIYLQKCVHSECNKCGVALIETCPMERGSKGSFQCLIYMNMIYYYFKKVKTIHATTPTHHPTIIYATLPLKTTNRPLMMN